MYSWVPPGISGYKAARFDYADWSQKKRVEEARRLYKEAGYSLSNPLTVEIRYNTSENHKKLAIAIAAMWKQTLGVKTRLVNEEWQACLRPRDRFWDIPVPKIDSAFDNLFVPQPSWSPSTTQQL
ncbi:ABC transporter substrate-binding protein, partial [Thiolapillus sp.]|uniref:ABC transporter substrate-binding protein n=1 Tax=Thiolapillus sp. TaxID=2017437 RepID=UPI003AF53C3D